MPIEDKLWLPPLSPKDQKRLARIQSDGFIKATYKRIGLSGKTLWDWLQLLAVLAIPVVVAFVSISFSTQQDANNQRQHQIDLKIAQDNRQNDVQLANDQQQEATLKSYLDDMSDLLLNHNLRNPKPADEVRQVARERTLTALRRLKANRNKIVLQFLQDAQLIGIKNAVIDLSNADLGGDDLSGANLSNANLRGANLSYATLSYADLSNTNLSYTILSNADLSYAILSNATVTNEQLAQAKSLAGATMPDGSIHP